MKEHFLTYEQSLAAKELGFDEPCIGYWKTRDWLVEEKTRTDGYTHADQECSAPLKSQFFEWVREKYGYNGVIEGDKVYGYEFCIYSDTDYYVKPPNNSDTYKQAEGECIKKIIELIKNK